MKFKALALLLTAPLFAQAKSLNTISSYEDNYAIGTYTSDINDEAYEASGSGMDNLQHFEVKFQLSVSVPLYRFSKATAVVGSYTQKSLWQLANSDISSPFRETNYKPQLFIAHQSNMLLFNHLEVGYKHESNGRSSALSRSWDRLYLAAERLDGPLEYGVHLWSVVGDTSENRDIEDYYAPYEIWMKLYSAAGIFNARGFYNWDDSRGGVEVGYTFYFNDLIGIYIQAYHGYGETLIDYDHNQTRIGAGFKLVRW
ncbi:TPA: phospholipase [Vibrio vulnificus]|uniref:phospholipase A n=1 Tax=Vibrio vulnificus TaxID=672 RepID=UPI0010288D90|nr:phospholipase A [Vibrio vulnificus]EGQ7991376.1 phospholipase A [Vibrio vulnificus]EGR7965260.1 phospholipase A [Vibrio vulnificus]EHK9182927.1 phospholipase A [Vibrio vulnificus]EHV2841117.1 phospholipase A [Vibrio vulnificus]EHZ2753388.1 phospholipase A [Vibrio vulnificus]